MVEEVLGKVGGLPNGSLMPLPMTLMSRGYGETASTEAEK
jgi:hypothetical protein